MTSNKTQLATGVTKETLEDGKILLFKVETVNQSSIDAWYAELHQLIANWSADQPYLVIYDMTHPAVTLTPYMRKKAAEINGLRQDVQGRIALILKPNPFTYVFRFFLKSLRGKSRTTAIFFERNHAINWVSQDLTPQSQ